MKTLLVVLVLLGCVVPAFADVVTVQDGWTVVYHIEGEPSSRWLYPGTYEILFPASATYGVVYLFYIDEALGHESIRLLGFLGQVPLPEGFPQITYECPAVSNIPNSGSTCRTLHIIVIPPPPPVVQAPVPPASCGTRRPVGHASVVVVGGLPDDAEIIGPFATPKLAQKFADKNCAGDYSIEPLTR